MKTISGKYIGTRNTAVGCITRKRLPLSERKGKILVCDVVKALDIGYAGFITREEKHNLFSFLYPALTVTDEFITEIHEGDVVRLSSDDFAEILWESQNTSNAFFLTESCNCHCVMCPQPPKKHKPSLLKEAFKVLDLAPESYTGEVCITGGEPTLLGDDFVKLLKSSYNKFKNASHILLTNGKTLSNFQFAKYINATAPSMLIAVSLHADIDSLHDTISGVKNSFFLTQQGIYNLGRLGQPLEIRVVISKYNWTRLPAIANYIYRNFPFAVHVTFMALEMTGHARDNYNEVWIDTPDYANELEESLLILHRAGMNVSAYNNPLCLLTPPARHFARRSISKWKNSYLDKCSACTERTHCCGVFTTSGNMLSSNISPL